jgi:hypothetical protein
MSIFGSAFFRIATRLDRACATPAGDSMLPGSRSAPGHRVVRSPTGRRPDDEMWASYAPVRDAFARVTWPSWAARQSDRLRAPS